MKQLYSNCCHAEMRLDYAKDICPVCKEGCGVEEGEDECTQFYNDNPFDFKEAIQRAIKEAAEPVREEEHLLGYDVGKEGGDKTVALYGKRHEDGSVEITKTVRGLPLETPYEPRVGDRVVMEAVVMMVTPDLSGPQLVVEHKRNDGEKLYIKVFASDMYLLSREIRSLTKIRIRSLTHGEARRERED